jgi:hypothetical protein
LSSSSSAAPRWSRPRRRRAAPLLRAVVVLVVRVVVVVVVVIVVVPVIVAVIVIVRPDEPGPAGGHVDVWRWVIRFGRPRARNEEGGEGGGGVFGRTRSIDGADEGSRWLGSVCVSAGMCASFRSRGVSEIDGERESEEKEDSS